MAIQSLFKHIKISGIVAVSGQIQKSIDDEIDAFGGDKSQIERIKKSIGIHTRYITDDRTTTFDLTKQAAYKLIRDMKIEKESIDGIVFVTQTPDYRMPGNSHLLHKELGLSKSSVAFDVNLGCSGYIYGLWLAYSILSSSTCKRILLCVGDTLSKTVHKRDRACAPIFGDVSTVTLVDRTQEEMPSYFLLYSDGSGFDQMIQPAGGYRMPCSEQTKKETIDKDGNIRTLENFCMNGFEVFSFTMTEQPPLLQEILEYSQKRMEDIDYFVLHQANSYIIKNIIRKARIPLDKVPYKTFETLGNHSCASIPATICHELYDKVSMQNLNLVLQGFGSGLSWGACSLSVNKIYCPCIHFYQSK